MRRVIEITVGGKDYKVKADFATIERIEDRFDLMTFLRAIQAYKTRTKDVAWVLYCALSAAGYDVKYQDIGDVVLNDFEGCATAAAEIAAEAFGAGPEKQSKKKSKGTAAADTPESESTTE